MLDGAATALLERALAGYPLDYGYPVTIWTVADLTDRRDQRGRRVSRATVSRALQRMGYRDRRPRHDLNHRLDADAVVSAKHVLRELQKRGLLPELDFGLSQWTNATCTPIPTWQRNGNGAASR